MNLGSIEEDFYSPQHSKILRAFADQAAIAIENANLYQITQATAEQALAYSALQLARSNALIVSLAEVASRVGTTLDLDIICETLGTELEKLGMQTVVNVLELDGKTLATHYMTIDLNTQKKINEALGLSGSNYAGPMIVADADTTREFIEARRAELEANPVDYFAATIFSSIPRSRAEELLHQVGIDSNTTLFWFPLMVKDQVVGTMTVWGKNLEKRDNLALSAFAGNVAGAILNARLYQAEHEQRELAEALRDSAAALNSTLSLSEVLNRILDNVGRVLPHDTANIMLIEDGVAHVVGKRGYAERNLDSELEIARWRVEELFDLRRMYETGQPLAIPDTQVEPNWLTLPNYEWIRSAAGAPIQLGDKVIGFLNLESATAGFFSANDALRLQAFAQQASIAIHNARLYQAEREQRELSDALKRSAGALSSTLSLEEVLDRILDNVGEVLPHDAANIMLIESGVGYMVGKRGYTQRGLDEQVKAARWVVKDIPNMRTIVETKKPLVIPDTQENPNWVVRRESSWIRSIVGAPIKIENEVIGLLNLDSATPEFFSDKDTMRLQAFADQAAIGIHNARLYEAERYERILAQTLQKTASALIRTIETQDTLTLIMDQLAEVVPYDHVLLMMVEETYLRPVASRGFHDDQPSASGDYPYSEITFMRNILASGNPLVVGDIQSHENVGDLPGVLPTTRAWMAIPLITWGVVTGLLIVGCNQQDRYNDKTLGAGVAFAQQAAIAIENVRMVTHLSETVFNLREAQARLERAARLSAAGEIAAGVAHQINNPLTAIIAESSLLLQDLTPVDPGYESAVAIREAANLAGSIVQRQLNLSRSIPYSMQPVDINQSLSNAVSLIHIQIESIAAIILNLQSDLPDVMGSPEHLADVWLNLLLNARDALVGKDQGQIHITTKLIIDENMILITIEDNGQGISQEHLGRIFDPFFTTKVRGHGLGLPVCYEVIRRHHGTITVDSQQGIGTTIAVTLPLIKDDVREQASEESGNVSYSHH
jgi:GAF domain-containing protein